MSMPAVIPYASLDPRTELEQAIAADMDAALQPRGAHVVHHGTKTNHAPSTAPADITIEWNANLVLVEVTQRLDDSEFVPIKDHLDRAVAKEPAKAINLLYASPRTSARMARTIRDENLRRQQAGISGRIIFVPFPHLQAMLEYWAKAPSKAYPLTGLVAAIGQWSRFTDDVSACEALQETFSRLVRIQG